VSDTQEDRAPDHEGETAGTGNESGDVGLRMAYLGVLSRAFSNVAHDVQNHIAAINESAGWMGDLLTLKKKGQLAWLRRFLKRGEPRVDVKPFLDILDTIQEQVAQGSAQNRRFGDFAHRLKEPRSVFSANRALREIEGVLLKEATGRGIDLEIKFADSTPIIEAAPRDLQLATFSCIEEALGGIDRKARLLLETEVKDGHFHICLTSPSPAESSHGHGGEHDSSDFCRVMVEDMGGRILKPPDDEKHVTILVFPLAGEET
jgi:two-component system NtrC family sensor kinase